MERILKMYVYVYVECKGVAVAVDSLPHVGLKSAQNLHFAFSSSLGSQSAHRGRLTTSCDKTSKTPTDGACDNFEEAEAGRRGP